MNNVNKAFAVKIPHHNIWTGVKTIQKHFLPVPSNGIILLAKLDKDAAIKMYRERYGTGLLEAKYAITQIIEPLS